MAIVPVPTPTTITPTIRCRRWTYEYEAHASGGEFNGNSDIDGPDEQMEALQYCAATFEEWAYRFWIENRISEAVESEDKPSLDEDRHAYQNHYRNSHQHSPSV
ncbi:hypothetical protein ACGFYT_29385 [Streptomyces sp. NPDC048208]|uniref:hypothetical protein n=1 Tax=Streptomyces sp. NPDC048208 TaxID=3365515 RepID=UPI0037128612